MSIQQLSKLFKLKSLLVAYLLCVASLAFAVEPNKNIQTSVKALEWRNIGPFNGGRGSSVVGHPTDRNIFWFGHSSGGLWKTEDAGTYWLPVGQGQFRYASVGAIALHEKDPNIMYVGLGEPQMRQSASWGDGVYKTTDGGETWQHLGLKEARQISQITYRTGESFEDRFGRDHNDPIREFEEASE